MPESTPEPSFQSSRPIERSALAGSPIQRSNYGIPPRQTNAAPATFVAAQPMARPPQPTMPAAGPRMMDVAPAAPRPAAAVAPVAPAQPSVAQAPQPVAPQFTPSVSAQPVSTPPAATPIFTATRTATQNSRDQKSPGKLRSLAGKSRLPLLIVGALLLIGGGVRLATAGNVSGYTIAVGAVTLNDGKKTTIQFTADDGQLHRFSLNEGSRDKTPGTAVQVAYQPGAADATVTQVATVKSARKLGTTVLALGILVTAIAALNYFLRWRKARPAQKAASQAVPVTA